MSPYDNPLFPCLNTPPIIAVPLFVLLIVVILMFSHRKEEPVQPVQTQVEIEETGTVNGIYSSNWDANSSLYVSEKPGVLTTNKPSDDFGEGMTIISLLLN